MMIPFIRVFPDGQMAGERVERPTDIVVLASSFLARGGRYMISILSDDEVRIAAIVEGLKGDAIEVAADAVPNGPPLIAAIDRLVRASVAKLDEMQ